MAILLKINTFSLVNRALQNGASSEMWIKYGLVLASFFEKAC